MDKKAMEEFENILLNAFKEAISNDFKKPEKEDCSELESDAKIVAETNKKLFDAHVNAGFTAEQAIQLVVAYISE